MDSADDEEDDEFHIRISEFPSSFTLNDAIKSEKKASFECNKLEEELKDGYSTNEETIRTKNLVSYLAWRLGEKEKALTHCGEIIAVDPFNIIALSNKGRYLRFLSRYHEADGVLKTLQLLRIREDFDCLLTSAWAEMAYSYSRFGPRFHDKCISIFERVINKSPEKNIWKFGLALTYRRETHFLNSPPKVKGACEENASKALMLLCEITASAECTENLKAKTWCEIGKILHGKNKYHQIFSRLPKNMASLTSEDCFLRALKICPDDIFVLQRCGQQFRYFKKLDKSIECLKRAQSIRQTPSNLHQLALSLIKQVEVEHVKFRRSLTFDPNVVRPKSDANLEQTLTQNRSHKMAKLNISSPTHASSHVRTFVPDQLHNSSENPVEYNPYSSLDDQNNQRQKHHQRYTKFRCGNDTHESEKSQEFANQPLQRPRGRRGRSYTPQTRNEVKRTRYPGTSAKVTQLCIKSPKKVEVIPNCPRLLEAAECLRRAVVLRKGNFSQALFDLGLVYRKLDLCDEAIKSLTQSYIQAPSKLEKIRALEQTALCKLHFIENKECSEEQATVYYSDAKKNLYKAVSLMAGLCSLQPQLENALNCFPTLRSMLLEEKIPENMSATRQLAELHSMMGDYKDAILLYEEIQECLRGETPVEVLLDLLKNYEKGEDFDNAILLLNLMMVAEDTRRSIDNERYIGLHIDAWEFYVKKNQKEMATQYLLDAFTFARQSMPRKDNIKDEIKAYILCSCDETTCSIGENIKMNLNSLCGIPSLHNTKDCLPGTRRLRYLEESLHNCEFILLIKNCEFPSEISNFYIELVIASDEFRSKVVLIGNAEMDPKLRILQRVAFPETNDVTIGWLKDLFEKVLLGRDYLK